MDSTLLFSNAITLTNITSVNNGGVVYVENTRAILNLNTVVKISYTNANNGGIFYIKNAKSIDIIGNTYNYFHSNLTGAIMYSESTMVAITIK